MIRQKLFSMLEAYAPTTEEIVFKKEIMTFMNQTPQCFERSSHGHITASAWIVNHNNTHALLTHHAKLNRWFQLGGHCDGDSDVLAVALKEAYEESGLTEIIPLHNGIFDIDIHMIPDTPKEKAHYHYDIRFLLQAVKDEPFIVSNESKSLTWIPRVKESIELFKDNKSVIRLFNKWLTYPYL